MGLYSRIINTINKLSETASANHYGKLGLIGLLSGFIYDKLVHGFEFKEYVEGEIFKMSRREKRNTISWTRTNKICKALNDSRYVKILEEKQIFNQKFKDYIGRDWLYSPDMTFEEFSALCIKHDELIVKPSDLLCGMGVYKLQSPKDDIGQRKVYDELKSKRYMIEEVIKQHPEMSFGGKAVNTIRVYTLLTKSGDVKILKSILRASAGNSVVDNYAMGGVIYSIDVDKGYIESVGQSHALGNKVAVHPNTEILMLGRKIPNYDKIKDLVVEAAKLLPQCRYIGWDVAVTSDSVLLIEGNHNPDHSFLEYTGLNTKWWPYFKSEIH